MTAAHSERTTPSGDGTHVPQGRQAYYDALRTLSQASLDQHFEAFRDIAWDDPEMQVAPGDERFILSDADEIGRHHWYKALPRARQIEIANGSVLSIEYSPETIQTTFARSLYRCPSHFP